MTQVTQEEVKAVPPAEVAGAGVPLRRPQSMAELGTGDLVSMLARVLTGLQQPQPAAVPIDRLMTIIETSTSALESTIGMLRDEVAFWRARALTLENEVSALKIKLTEQERG